jgi:hypothetical protein
MKKIIILSALAITTIAIIAVKQHTKEPTPNQDNFTTRDITKPDGTIIPIQGNPKAKKGNPYKTKGGFTMVEITLPDGTTITEAADEKARQEISEEFRRIRTKPMLEMTPEERQKFAKEHAWKFEKQDK